LPRDLTRIGWVAATIMAALSLAWVVSLALIPGPSEGLDLASRLAYLDAHPEAFVGPALVVGLAILHVPVWLGLAAVVWSLRPAAGVLAVCFGLVYATLASINYWAQLTVVRGLADLAATDPSGAVAAYRLFEFPGGLTSLSYGIDVLAYSIWGIAAIAIAVGLLAFEARLPRATGLLCAVSGVLAIAGGAGFVIENDLLELGVLLSGIGFLVALIAAAVLMRRHTAAEGSLLAGLSLEVRVNPTRT
jgi:hypothetical protein